MTYLCPCGGSFDQVYDYFGPCLWCGGMDYEKEEHCRLCAKAIPESQAEFYLCPDCEKKAKAKLAEFLGGLEPEEVAYLDGQLDGNSLTDFEWRKEDGQLFKACVSVAG